MAATATRTMINPIDRAPPMDLISVARRPGAAH